ncbi:hypothetical protein [Natrinema halophilum]|uniref:Uncharacterized protein n=1 Tax=Natrinema halophilum TaxID=1699371 RepID=A0A7D5GRX9_9EURY|nr:hypothetical protein [Natrinema halophilum]QLG48306.1 hypothetical protein HYG82_05300 [Natrinema halophilum]
MNWGRASETIPGRIFGAVAGVTVVLTASMVGVVALVSGKAGGAGGRFPYYVLLTAIAFVISLWKLDDETVDGTTVLIATSGIAIGSGSLVSLAIEGIVFGSQHPDRIVGSRLLVYFVAAGLICTALGMWSLRHWREFTMYDSS